MAQAIADTLEHGGRLMVEAGTGTGKTLAYIVPALNCGRRVIVSTGTRNLQDQIFEKDLPFLRDRVGLEFRATMMKGRDNYLCRYRLAQFEREPLLEELSEAPWIERITAWSRTTSRGDRTEIGELPDGLRLWRDVNARADTCTGTRCPEYDNCWLTRLKREAQQSQVVVVNHHLFFADLALRTAFGAVLPDYDTVIFDEAHLLEEIATLYFGVQVSARQLDDLASAAEKLASRHGGPARGGGGAARLRLAGAEFFAPLRQRLSDGPGRRPFDPPEQGGPDLEGEWAALCAALDEVGAETGRLEVAAEEVESVPRRAEELRIQLGHVLKRRDSGYVYGMELRGPGNVVLSASPIDVSGLLRGELFDRLHATVLTSATLTVQGSFDFFARRLGLEGPQTETATIESSFDYGEQALLYLPSAMPEPREATFVERVVQEVRTLTRITAGRAFVLFTSYANLNQVCRALREDDEWPLFVQGEGSKAALVERFRRTPRAVLLGTTSFWHGVDVPGDALSLVVVDKLPFGVPSDPLTAARIAKIREESGNPFLDYQVPLAVLELKQGLGRLLRSASDRGILAVLDPRLTTRRYGRVFLESLPPFRRTRDVRQCQVFFPRCEPGDAQ